jgi:hypothetical protein
LERTIHNFQKDKITGPNGFRIDFYKGFFEIVGEYLLRMIYHSRRSGKIHSPFNSTFISLIPKVDDPINFDQLRTISQCKNVYKMIEKIIAWRIKDILNDNIYEEQFIFLRGKKIHQEIG